MDKTLRTIREEIRKNREGNIPALTLVIDTNVEIYFNSGECLQRIKEDLRCE